MPKKYKIIIASILAGSGHNTAADLVAQVLGNNPNFEIIRYTNPSKSIDRQYNDMTKNSPIVHNFFVNHAPVITSDAITLSMIHFADDCIELIKRERPDCVISTHFVLANYFKLAQWVTKINYITMECFLDYGKRMTGEIPYNLYMRQDYSIVFDDEACASIISKTKQNKTNIIVTGYRAKEEFISTKTKYISKEAAREKLKDTFKEPIFNQISKTKTTIIIAGGGGGIIQKTKGFLKKLAQFQKRDISLLDRFQFFIVCGQNEKYNKTLLKLRKTRLSWQNIFPFGWLNSEQYALLQKSADYPILYGIAPATMHELMTNECVPLLIHRIRADHELRNVEFVEDRGIGKYLKKDSDLIKDIFSNKYFLEKEIYLKKSDELLKEEEERLTIFSEIIYDTLQRKTKPIYAIYQTNFRHKLFSSTLSSLFIMVYYLRRAMYKFAGIFPWILKKFPKEF